MKRYGRRLLALLLALTLGMNMVITAWAAETEGEATNHDNVELSGSLGGMLAAELENGTETAARGSRNGVMNLTVDGSAATVTYQTDVSANVAVALYDETTGRMLQTAMAEADSEANAVTVQFAGGGIPEYFVAKAFLLDRETSAPLGRAYQTERYTSAEKYYENHSALIDTIVYQESDDVPDETQAIALLADRGFGQERDGNGNLIGYPVTYDYAPNGSYVDRPMLWMVRRINTPCTGHSMFQKMKREIR